MPQQLFANNAKSTLAATVSSNTQATLTVQTGHGARFPIPYAPNFFLVTLDDGTNVEICKCIAIAGDVLTVLRGFEGTTAQSSFATGTRVELRLTADSTRTLEFRDFINYHCAKATANITSWQVIGVTVPTMVSSAVAATLTNSSWREQNARIRLTMGNSAQQRSSLRIAQPCVNPANGYRFITRFGFNFAPNSSHFFVGMVNTTGATVQSVNPPTSLTCGIVIGYDNGTVGSNLAIYTNGGSGSAIKRDLGSYFTVTTQAWYEFEIYQQPLTSASSSRVDYTVRRLDISSIADVTSYFTTNFPSSQQWLNPYLDSCTMVNSAIATELGGFWWET